MISPGIYRHYKRGRYEVTGFAVDCNTLESVVIYQSLDDHEDYPKGTVWVRPLREFESSVEVDGNTVARFAREE